eukprot:scpid107584/ scgid18641/ 
MQKTQICTGYVSKIVSERISDVLLSPRGSTHGNSLRSGAGFMSCLDLILASFSSTIKKGMFQGSHSMFPWQALRCILVLFRGSSSVCQNFNGRVPTLPSGLLCLGTDA